jgi:putative ABC transport system permease protein
MIINYFKTGFRNLLKRKGYTLLNILGITTGMTCCLLIFHYVSYERSFDSELSNSENIYRVRLDNYQQGKLAWKSATSYPAIAPFMKKEFPEVEDYCRLIDAEMLLANDEKNIKFKEEKGYYGEQSFIKMFDVNLISGNPALALTGPDKIIVSEKMAGKYFGTTEVLGKKLTVKDEGTVQVYEISGVFKGHPKNSHLTVEYIASFDTFKKFLRSVGDTSNPTETSFGWYDFYSYLQLKPGTDVKKLEAKMPDFCERNIAWTKGTKTYHEIYLTPLKDIHLYSNFNQEAEVNGNGQMVYFLFLIAIFIICIAWVNYINLSTARSVERAKEVGMKKVLGAIRSDLIKQFLVENFILNVLSLIFSLGLFYGLLSAFDTFAGRDGFTGVSLTYPYWKIFILLFIGGTFLSGVYPAFVLSNFQPIRVLKGAFKNTSKGVALRKGLIVLQFVITVVLIAGTVIVYQQVQFMRKQNLGVNIERTLVLNAPATLQDSVYKLVYQPFKTELLQQPGIKNVSASSNVMGQEIYWTNGSRRLEAPKESAVTLYNLGVDFDFIPAYGMKLRAGRNFSSSFTSDKKAAILNEKAVALLGFKNADEAVNSKIKRQNDTLTVVGVVADYHQQGLQKNIDPMILLPRPNIKRFYSIKLQTEDTKNAMATIEKIWSKHFPGDPYLYFFLDDSYNAQYKADILFGKVFSIFAFLAILIACSGLLGLSAYNVLQRSKEIGIRKVLGASAENILLLLSKDFIKLIIISLLLALPIGWYVMNRWLEDFAYRIDIKWWVFAVAGIVALVIAAITILLQAFKSVIENPVKSLRTE